MGSIPHNQSNTTVGAHGTPTVLLWALLLVSLLGVMVVLGYRSTHVNEVIHKGDSTAAAEPAAATLPNQVPAVFNQQAEPLTGNAVPHYPAELLAAGLEADVVVRLQIDANGAVTQASVPARDAAVDARFEEAALQALQQWRFRPEVREGHAVSSVVQVPVEFRRER